LRRTVIWSELRKKGVFFYPEFRIDWRHAN
jgi:hypothetical protein